MRVASIAKLTKAAIRDLTEGSIKRMLRYSVQRLEWYVASLRRLADDIEDLNKSLMNIERDSCDELASTGLAMVRADLMHACSFFTETIGVYQERYNKMMDGFKPITWLFDDDGNIYEAVSDEDKAKAEEFFANAVEDTAYVEDKQFDPIDALKTE